MIGKQTTLDLNGPILSFIQQPQSISVCDSGSATFVGIATAFFPTQDPPNPASNTGTLSYRWNAEGFGPLTDGTFRGATITGSGTTTLTIVNATSPIVNGLRLFVGVDYVPSAYSQPVGSAVTVGTGRSTGNALNEILNSNSATLTVFPSLSVATQPTNQTVSANIRATFTTLGALTDTTQGSISYRWQLNGNDLIDSATVTGSGTPNLSISLSTDGTNTIRARLTHPSACNSPVFTDNATFTVETLREIINIERVTDEGQFRSAESTNIYNTSINLTSNQTGATNDVICVYAPEKDIRVLITLAGAAGQSSGSVRGGSGGISLFEYTLKRNTEYVFILNSAAYRPGYGGGGAFFYEKARLVAASGGGGDAGPSYRGGDGGGIGNAGESGQGPGAGIGASRVADGTLPTTGVDKSGALINNSFAQYIGGRVSGCTTGNYYQQQGFSPCQDVGQRRWTGSSGIVASQTAVIQRGFKAGQRFTNNGGNVDQGGSLITQTETLTINATVDHVFNNATNIHTFTSSSPNVRVSYENPNAADNLPCSTNSSYKHYSILFLDPFDNTNYTISVTSISPLTANGGAPVGGNRVGGIVISGSTGFRIWFCRNDNSANTYVRQFKFSCTGPNSTTVRSSPVYAGGGGSGAIGGNGAITNGSGGGGGSGYFDGSAISGLSSGIGGGAGPTQLLNRSTNSYATIQHLL